MSHDSLREKFLVTKSQLVDRPKKLRRHIVILGAGASVAAFPNGDANGKKLPTMDNFIELLGLGSVLERAGVTNKKQNFETVYSELHKVNPASPILREIENAVYDYFSNLKLPECPTLYDHLLLSLRPKDVIATFNWDPFLFDAWNRNKGSAPVPDIVHLHGNVRITHCPGHGTWGEIGMSCPKCGTELIPTRLLYPVTKKNYTDNIYIKTEWEFLKTSLRQAMTLTIFGYSAPDTDAEAIELMKSAWDKKNRFIERTEVVDIKSKEDLWKQWNPFIVETYLDHSQDYYGSRISQYPRRSCEALVKQTMFGQWVETNQLPKDADFDDLFSWLDPLVSAERLLAEAE